MPDINELLKDAARGPADYPGVDALWRRGRRRRNVTRAVAAGPIAIVVVAAAMFVPRLFQLPRDVQLVQPPSESATTPPSAAAETKTVQVGGAQFDVPADWPVRQLNDATVGDVCLDHTFGGHVVYVARDLPPACPESATREPGTQAAVYATALNDVPESLLGSGEQRRGTYGVSYVARIDDLYWYQFVDMNLLLVVQSSEPVLDIRIVETVRPVGFADVNEIHGPSQTPEAAKRDGVPPEWAATSIADRVRAAEPVRLKSGLDSRVRTSEGVWVASSPRGHGGEYGEIVLLNERGTRIRRAYPLPGLPPSQLLVTDDAIYCSRQGDGGLPNSMLCRIDRGTGELDVRVFLAGDGDYPEFEQEYRRRGWTVDTHRDVAVFYEMRLIDEQIVIEGHDGRAVVDAVTLELNDVERR